LAERPVPANRLTEWERDRIVDTCNAPRFASLPPSQIVPKLADEGVYIASESSFYRVLRERGQNHRRGRARKPGRSRPPASFQAKRPREVWSWDIAWLPGLVLGMFFYLYLIVDIYSRVRPLPRTGGGTGLTVGWDVHERESAELAAGLLEPAVWAQGCVINPLILRADNGSPMKGATMKVTMERLGVIPSFSRPRVSNDNPFSEALFSTCKYVPSWPAKGFASIDEARAWVLEFAHWYNTQHQHSAIRFVTPRRAIAARTKPSSPTAMPSIRPRSKSTPRDGQARRETGNRSMRSGSIPSGLRPDAEAMGAPTRSPQSWRRRTRSRPRTARRMKHSQAATTLTNTARSIATNRER
jgi:transposase InsO family protein